MFFPATHPAKNNIIIERGDAPRFLAQFRDAHQGVVRNLARHLVERRFAQKRQSLWVPEVVSALGARNAGDASAPKAINAEARIATRNEPLARSDIVVTVD